jgi:hypothetical protein
MEPAVMVARQHFARPRGKAISAIFILTLFLAAGWIAGLQAQQWPVLKQGMWEFTRTMQPPGGGAPKIVTSKRCIDPVADMQRQNATMAKSGCTISAPAKTGNAYTFTAACRIMGISSNTTTTLVAENDSAYTLTVEGTTDGEPTKETMKARRTGDCAK